jgi:hypothetical protein
MGKRTWLLWSSVVLTSTLRAFDGSRSRSRRRSSGETASEVATRRQVRGHLVHGPATSLEPTSLTFTAAQTATSYDDVRTRAPRSLRFLRGPNGYPLINSVENDPDLVTALTRRGVNYVANDVDLMGGHWDANGATPDGFTRLFMITDDVGYAYWHIPTTDLAAARFDRVVGGWTD